MEFDGRETSDRNDVQTSSSKRRTREPPLRQSPGTPPYNWLKRCLTWCSQSFFRFRNVRSPRWTLSLVTVVCETLHSFATVAALPKAMRSGSPNIRYHSFQLRRELNLPLGYEFFQLLQCSWETVIAANFYPAFQPHKNCMGTWQFCCPATVVLPGKSHSRH